MLAWPRSGFLPSPAGLPGAALRRGSGSGAGGCQANPGMGHRVQSPKDAHPPTMALELPALEQPPPSPAFGETEGFTLETRFSSATPRPAGDLHAAACAASPCFWLSEGAELSRLVRVESGVLGGGVGALLAL